MSLLSCWLIGSDTLLLECAQSLLDAEHDLRGVVTDQERIRRWCVERDVPVLDGTGDWEADLAAAEPFDVLFAITWLRIVPDAVLALPRRIAVNFHDGPLPRYAGLNTPVWGLINREPEWGVSWHLMTPGVDEGPILKQVRFPVTEGETALSLNTRCLAAAVSSFPELLAEIAEDRTEPTAQDLTDRTVYRSADRPPGACLVDWTSSTDQVVAFVRALTFGPHPNPVGLAKTASAEGGHILVIDEIGRWDANQDARIAPGEVVALTSEGVVVATGDGAAIIRAGRGLDGTILDLSALEAGWGMTPGRLLITPEAARWMELDAADRAWGRHEPFWIRRLTAAEAADLPVGTPGAERRGWSTVSRPLPEVVRGAFAGRLHEAVAAALAVVLARLGPRDAVGLATPPEGLPGDAYARFVPMNVVLEAEQSFSDVLADVAREREVVGERGSFLLDLPLRLPDMSTEALRRPVVVGSVAGGEDEAIRSGVLLAVAPSPDDGTVEISFAEGPLDAADAERLGVALVACLEFAARHPETPWTDLPLVTREQRDTLLEAWNDTDRDYDRTVRIQDLFRRQVEQTPDRPALSFEGRRLTYRELDDRVDALAAELRGRGVGPDTLVGIHVDRSLDLPVAVMAVLRAGAAYLPLDPDFPPDRLAFMLEDAGAAWVLTRSELAGALPSAFADRLLPMDGAGGSGTGSPGVSDGSDAEVSDEATLPQTSDW